MTEMLCKRTYDGVDTGTKLDANSDCPCHREKYERYETDVSEYLHSLPLWRLTFPLRRAPSEVVENRMAAPARRLRRVVR